MSNPLDDLLVGIPVAELGYGRFWQYLVANPDFGYLVHKSRVLCLSSSVVQATQTSLVLEALKEDTPPWKRLLWLEHDHVFPWDVFQRHAAYGEPIVGGMYVKRDVQWPVPVMYNWDAPRKNALEPKVEEVKYMLEHPGLHKVDAVPMGCTSIAREVFEGWPKDKPYFTMAINPGGSAMTSDIYFCRTAQDNGWQSYIDTSLKVEHLTLVPLTVDTFVHWWNRVGAEVSFKQQQERMQRLAEEVEEYVDGHSESEPDFRELAELGASHGG